VSERDLPDYVKLNREHWTRNNAAYTDGRAEYAWNEPEISWGVWNTPESEINVLPDIAGKDVVELGCGTAYVAAWLKRRGARRVVGVDITPAQLATAQRLNTKYGLCLELVEANAEATGLAGASFDLAISEYGASIWCDPYKWIPEAARLLRPDGELVFLRNSTLSILCMPDEGKVSDRLVRPQLGLHRLEWADDPEVEFHLGHGDLMRLLRESGFDVLDLVELYASADSIDHPFYGQVVSVEWARKWPSEEMWRARKRS
jgi:ubiquinone/menaquinone biosynthesis C-methylase UbiE